MEPRARFCDGEPQKRPSRPSQGVRREGARTGPQHFNFGFGTVWWNVMSHMWHDWLEAPSPLISTSSNTTPSILLSANPSQSRAESSTRIDTFFTVIPGEIQVSRLNRAIAYIAYAYIGLRDNQRCPPLLLYGIYRYFHILSNSTGYCKYE